MFHRALKQLRKNMIFIHKIHPRARASVGPRLGVCCEHFGENWLAPHCILLTHWGRVTHICVGNLTIIGSDNGLSPGRRQAIIWTNAGMLLIGPLGTNFSENLIEILTFSFTKMRLKLSSANWRPFCLGLNVLRYNTCPPTFPVITPHLIYIPHAGQPLWHVLSHLARQPMLLVSRRWLS